MSTTPEIGTRVVLGDLDVNYHDIGTGEPVMLIHGSGPGVSAWANWRKVIPELQDRFRLVAPDMIGFGYTSAPKVEFDLAAWVGQVIGLADHLGIDRFSIIGNSFGGSIALHVAHRHPDRVKRIVLMGASGTVFDMTPGLEAVWGYTPSREKMAHLLRDVFVYDGSTITEDLIDMRYDASRRETVPERFEALFPAPRRRWLERLAPAEDDLRTIRNPALLVHGRDDKVVPLSASERAVELLPDARLAVIPECGHWVQIEKTDEFCRLAGDFLAGESADA